MLAKRNPNHDACNRQLTAAAAAGRQQHSALSCCWQLLLLTFTTTGGKKLVDTMPAPLITGFLTCLPYNLRHATLRLQASWEMHWKQTKGALLIIPLGWCWSLERVFGFLLKQKQQRFQGFHWVCTCNTGIATAVQETHPDHSISAVETWFLSKKIFQIHLGHSISLGFPGLSNGASIKIGNIFPLHKTRLGHSILAVAIYTFHSWGGWRK